MYCIAKLPLLQNSFFKQYVQKFPEDFYSRSMWSKINLFFLLFARTLFVNGKGWKNNAIAEAGSLPTRSPIQASVGSYAMSEYNTYFLTYRTVV